MPVMIWIGGVRQAKIIRKADPADLCVYRTHAKRGSGLVVFPLPRGRVGSEMWTKRRRWAWVESMVLCSYFVSQSFYAVLLQRQSSV